MKNVPDNRPNSRKTTWMLGAIGLFVVTKGKSILTLLNFSKFGGALISMFISIGAYALLFPAGFAIGLVVMILIHELGHVFAARQRGLPVSAPMFIPFMGALITMKRQPRDAVTEAYIAFGGPVLGTVGAIATLWLGMLTNNNLLVVIANVGFFINLINLMPIHPLDGGRISTAVTRWLWLVGLIGGLIFVYYFKSILFFIIWALFAWELLQKYVLNNGRGKQIHATSQIEIPMSYLSEQGYGLPGENHRRELNYDTYSTLDGQQKLTVHWNSIGLRQTLNLPQQGILNRVIVSKISYEPEEYPEKMLLDCRVDYVPYENDRYYEVPVQTRWKFGATYAGLALVLIYMLYISSGLGIQGI